MKLPSQVMREKAWACVLKQPTGRAAQTTNQRRETDKDPGLWPERRGIKPVSSSLVSWIDLTQLRTSSNWSPLGLCIRGHVPHQLSVCLFPSLSRCDTALTKLCPPLVPLDGCCSPRLPVRQRPPSTTCNYLRSSAAWRPLPVTLQKPPPWAPWRPPSSAAVGP